MNKTVFIIIIMPFDSAPNPCTGQSTASIDLQAQVIQTDPSCGFQAIIIQVVSLQIHTSNE